MIIIDINEGQFLFRNGAVCLQDLASLIDRELSVEDPQHHHRQVQQYQADDGQ